MINELSKQEYEKDFYAWAIHNADLIRQGRLSEVDLEHVAEEIESMGKRDKRKLVNRLAILISHLLKWEYQREKRGRSWSLTIKEQRIRINKLLKESPSLKHELEDALQDAYEIAIVIAARETGLAESIFPPKYAFNFEQCLELNFLPDHST